MFVKYYDKCRKNISNKKEETGNLLLAIPIEA
jgi:hypothetical protein